MCKSTIAEHFLLKPAVHHKESSRFMKKFFSQEKKKHLNVILIIKDEL